MERPDERMERLERLEREDDYYESRAPPPVTAAHTLGRYQKHGQRFSGSTPNLHQQQQDYRSAQTLPRKLHEQRTQRFGNAMEKQPAPGRGATFLPPDNSSSQGGFPIIRISKISRILTQARAPTAIQIQCRHSKDRPSRLAPTPRS